MLTFEDRVLLTFVIFASLAMVFILLPFSGAILWGVAAAILFMPINDWLLARYPGKPNQTATITLLLIIALVIAPAIVVGVLLVDQAITLYGLVQSRELDLAKMFEQVQAAMPDWMSLGLDRVGLGDIDAVGERLSAFFASGVRIVATQALALGQGAASFFIALSMMLYLTFFLLRDGRALVETLRERIPLRDDQRNLLFEKFATVIRATVKGNVTVAATQGTLGGIAFAVLGIQGALLWGVVMGLLSLIPVLGAGLIWAPVAVYLIATGSMGEGIALILTGVFVIGLVDNLLRPILVGKDTRIPDYVVLFATVGGLSVFGINGFIIGPVIAGMFLAAWEIFARSRQGEC